jgi:hypothetical protein
LVFGPQMGSNSESLIRDSKKKEPCQEGPRDVEKVDPQRPESFPRASKARDSIQPPPSKKKKKKNYCRNSKKFSRSRSQSKRKGEHVRRMCGQNHPHSLQTNLKSV